MDVLKSFIKEYSKFLIRPNRKMLGAPPIVILILLEIIYLSRLSDGTTKVAAIIAIFFIFFSISAPFATPQNIDRNSKYFRPYIYAIPFGMIMYFIVLQIDQLLMLG